MARVPLGGKNNRTMPTLIPNFDRPFANRGVVGLLDPEDYVSQHPRAAASAVATIGGTVTVGDTVTLTLTCGTLPGGAATFSYITATGDTIDDVANELADAINQSSEARDYDISAEIGGHGAEAAVTVNWDGPIGNFAVLSAHASGAATETVTFTPSNGALSGGSGPVICSSNFNYAFNGRTMSFFIGQPYLLGDPVLAAMVGQGEPII